MHYGIRTKGRTGITHRRQIEALAPYLDYMDDHTIYRFWEECNRLGWFDLRNWILTAEIFSPGMSNLGLPLDNLVLQNAELRSWNDEAILKELQRMEVDGLVHRRHEAWFSTFEGQVARERFVQSVGGRASCLRDPHRHELGKRSEPLCKRSLMY